MGLALLGRGAAAALVAAAALGYALPLMRFELNPYDEGAVVLGAEQVLKGRHPSIDFYTPYPPAVFYALAGVFQLAGTRLIVERAFAVGLLALCVALGCLLVTGLRPAVDRRGLSELLPALLIVSLAGVRMGVIWVTPVTGGALCLILLAALALRTALPSGRPLAGFATGALFGLAALWRSDFALYGVTAAVVVWLLRSGRPFEGDTRPPARRCVGGALAVALGAAVVALPVYALLVVKGGPRAFQGLFVWPILSTQLATLPWPRFAPALDALALPTLSPIRRAAILCQNWAYYFPLVAAGLGLWRLARWRSLSPAEINVGLWILVAGMGFFRYAAGRTDYIHLLPLLLFSLLFASLCIAGAFGERVPRRTWSRPTWLTLGVTIAVPALAALVPRPIDTWVSVRALSSRRVMEVPVPRGAGIFPALRYARQYGEVIRYLNENVPPGEKIYSGTPRHDIFMVNDVMLYFLAERDPGTYFWCLDAGVTTTQEVQEQMVRELRANGVNTVVRWMAAAPDRPISARRRTGSPVLDRLLGAFFPSPVPIGWYQVARRLGSTTPGE